MIRLQTELLLDNLRCPHPKCYGCLKPLQEAMDFGATEGLQCIQCQEKFPIINGVPRLLLSPLRESLLGQHKASGKDAQQVATARSFGYEWTRFAEMYEDWERNFLEYMAPHQPEFFKNKRVLDAGCGKGRHAYYAAKYGAEVWAIDLGPAVEVARRNTQEYDNVQVVQADLYQPPFDPEGFDFIYSVGVLHHLPDPERAFRNLLRFLKPGGEIQIYLYWKPEREPFKTALLAAVTVARQVTTRLPHPLVYALSFPAAWLAFALFVWPYRVLRRFPMLRSLAERLPMKQYADYPFRVCVNDQLDRLSAPIENRYTRAQVEAWLTRGGLENIKVLPNRGWVGSGRKPESAAQRAQR